MRLFVTGSSSSLVEEILSNIENVNILKIKNLTSTESNKMEFDSRILESFQEDDKIIHVAWNMKNRNEHLSKIINVNGSIKFFENLTEIQKKNFVFVSSVAAETMSVYGRHKKMVEDHVISMGGSVIRLGILYNENSNNLKFLENLKSVSKYLPFIPNFSGNKKIYYITTVKNIEDFLFNFKENVLVNCIEENSVNFKYLIQNILKIKKPIISFPFWLCYGIVLFLNKIFPTFLISSDSFLYIKTMVKK